jgi:hypothetical protein
MDSFPKKWLCSVLSCRRSLLLAQLQLGSRSEHEQCKSRPSLWQTALAHTLLMRWFCTAQTCTACWTGTLHSLHSSAECCDIRTTHRHQMLWFFLCMQALRTCPPAAVQQSPRGRVRRVWCCTRQQQQLPGSRGQPGATRRALQQQTSAMK